jgi:predicted AAA+ superfamily ATPase
MLNRAYNSLINEHFNEYRQMVFISGPRQVGKTTISKISSKKVIYFNWDNQEHRLLIRSGPNNLIKSFNLDSIENIGVRLVFDEIHKYSKWKEFLKGFFDTYGDNYKILVTGSSRLNVFKKGGDSLMGRYFPYRIHPLSVGELLNDDKRDKEISRPKKLSDDIFEQLFKFSGFPEPFLKANTRFYNIWKRLRIEQVFNEDLRDISRIQELKGIEDFAKLIVNQTGQLFNSSSFSNLLNVSVDTVRRWSKLLSDLYYVFFIKPWYSNVPKSLRKQPKVYMWDWSLIEDKGAKFENFIASHLLKSVNFWTDSGLGNYELFFLRDKYKREVDFLIAKDNIPWFLVEVKSSKNARLSPSIEYFADILKVKHSFQVVYDMEYVDRDCFSINMPVKVPALTFLSQLI